jgi:hypothetical protein
MFKNAHYVLLLIVLIASTGCETIHGAASGFNQDVHNVSDPDKNGWNVLEKMDAWIRQNLW